MKKIYLIKSLFIALLSIASAAANADTLADVKAKGELVVGTEHQFAPFDFLVNGKHEGINKDFFTEVAKDLGVKVRYIDLPWPSVLPGLEANKFDVVGGPVSVTKARMKRYNFTLPISDASVALLKKAGDSKITKPEDIAGLTVGAAKGSSPAEQLENYSNTLEKPVEIKLYTDNNQAYSEILTGRVDAVANGFPNIAYLASNNNKFEVVFPPFGKKAYSAYVLRKDSKDESLLEAINNIMLKMHEDGRMAAIQKKWFGVTMDDLPKKAVEPQI